ncbi:MAG TPA: hypothetical protein VKU00_33360 [Chthonomonadaceae bacterium]|nr:hypothetical protein [Chthonomonadaceae bacterium]
MQVPSYLLPRPRMDLSPELRQAFEALLAPVGEGKECPFLDYFLPVPKWQFLCYLTDTKDILLHGTGDPEISEFEPRPSDDTNPFGAQCAVYAAGDGIWPLSYAILNRERYPMGLHNGCVRFKDSSGRYSIPYYFFSITQSVLEREPWRSGVIYVLPRAGFALDPQVSYAGYEMRVEHWASLEPVKPLAKLRVQPEDFPFLAAIRGHDNAVLTERMQTNPDGFPWLDPEEQERMERELQEVLFEE